MRPSRSVGIIKWCGAVILLVVAFTLVTCVGIIGAGAASAVHASGAIDEKVDELRAKTIEASQERKAQEGEQ